MNVNAIVDAWVKGMKAGLRMWPEAVLVSVVDQVSEHPEVSSEEADAMLRTAILALIVSYSRQECARRI